MGVSVCFKDVRNGRLPIIKKCSLRAPRKYTIQLNSFRLYMCVGEREEARKGEKKERGRRTHAHIHTYTHACTHTHTLTHTHMHVCFCVFGCMQWALVKIEDV